MSASGRHHTVKWYEFRLDHRFLSERAVLADLTVANVRRFIAELQSRDVLPRFGEFSFCFPKAWRDTM